jgi:DNA-binding Lrp family transcriptional regulator
MTTSVPGAIDRLDAALIELLVAEPRVGVLEASRRLGVARGTVQARLDRLQDRGVITGYGPDVDPAALGYEVTAFITLEIRQVGGHDPVAERLAVIPEVLEVHTITGPGRDRLHRRRDPVRHRDLPRHPGPLPDPPPGPRRRVGQRSRVMAGAGMLIFCRRCITAVADGLW